jgi:hypothetical protein
MREVCGTLVALLLCGCAATPDGPASLEAMLAREVRALESLPIEHPTGLFRARAPGRLIEPFEDSDSSAYGRFEIGAGSPVACHFFFDRVDLASTLVRSSDVILAQAATEVGTAVKRAIERLDAGEIAGAPFLSLDWLFWMPTGGGELKQRAASRGGRSVYCAHDSPGFRGSFEGFFAALVETLDFPGNRVPEPFYREISVTSYREQRIGVSELRFFRDGTGDIRAETISATLTPTRSDAIGANDSHQVEWSHPNGALINAYFVAVDGDAVTELELVRASRRAWEVEGRHRSEPLETRFESAGELASSFGEYLAYHAVASGQRTIAFERWLPEADPSRPTPFAFERAEAADDEGVAVHALMGPLEVDLRLAASGGLESATSTIGEAEVRASVVLREGRIAPPLAADE